MTCRSFFGRNCLVALLLTLNLFPTWAEQTATVITSDPVNFANGAAHMSRPVRPDEVFRVVATNGDQITISDAYGMQATLPRTSLKITDLTSQPSSTNSTPVKTPPNVAVVPSAPVTNSPTVSPAASPSATAEVPARADASLSPEDADMMRRLNEALQMSLFADTDLWSNDVEAVASRLHWPQESKTTMDASYRRYALGNSMVSILGARAYSMALYARNGHPTYISIIFANKGDLPEMRDIADKVSKDIPVPPDEVDKAVADLNAAVKSDADTINTKLSDVLGAPEDHVFGPTSDSQQMVRRWDWKGHAILFSSPNNEYAALKIMPTEVADRHGEVENMDRDALKAALAQRVLKRDNGDVVIQEIPMVQQGPKGYCVPATWERYLRYVDVPADMYVLALLGNTGIGGGTSLGAIRQAIDGYVEAYHRRIEQADITLDTSHVSKFIDQGLPLMWGCYVQKDVENRINQHTAQRKSVADWSAYKQSLESDDKDVVLDTENARFHGHMRMIIGYNTQTDELAISDSWGTNFTERWITVKEAQTTSQNDLEYVQW